MRARAAYKPQSDQNCPSVAHTTWGFLFIMKKAKELKVERIPRHFLVRAYEAKTSKVKVLHITTDEGNPASNPMFAEVVEFDGTREVRNEILRRWALKIKR